MSAPPFDPAELIHLREQLEEMRKALRATSIRLGELEEIAVHYYSAEEVHAVAKPAPVKPIAQEVRRDLPEQTVERISLPEPARLPLELAIEPELKVAPLPGAGNVADLLGAAPPAKPEPPKTELGHTAPPPMRQPQPAFATRSRSRQEKPVSQVDWEAIIGGRWMTWVGAFTLLLAIGFGVHWAWSTFQTPPWLQVLAFHLLGAGFLVSGYYTRRRGLPVTTQALVGLSIFTLYAAAFAALHLYKLWPEQVAFVECAGLTVMAIALALYANSPAVVLLGALGGYLTPILTSRGSGNYAGLFTYLAFLNVALMTCAVWRDWRFLKPLTMAATVLMFAGWLIDAHFDPTDNAMVWRTQWFAVLHGVIFLVGSTIPPVAWKRTSQTADLFTLSANSLLFVGLTWFLFHDHPAQQLALVGWGMALLHGALFGLTYARVTNVDRMPRVHLALAAVFFTLAIPLQIDDSAYWGATWCVEAFTFTAIGLYFRDRQMCTTAAIVLLLGAARLLGWDYQTPPRSIGDSALDLRAAMFFMAGLITLVAGGLYRLIPWAIDRASEEDSFDRSTAQLLSAIGAALVVLAPTLQLTDWVYLGPTWAIEAIAFTILGLVARDRQMSTTGLIAFGMAAARLIAFDYASPARAIDGGAIDIRFSAFLFVGVLTLAFGAVHRRKDDTFHRSAAQLLSAMGAALVVLAPTLQLTDWVYLGPTWAVEAIAFSILGLVARDRQMSTTGLLVFGLAAARLIAFDFGSPARAIDGGAIDIRFSAFLFVGLLALACGAVYRIATRVPGGATQRDDVVAVFSRDISTFSRDDADTIITALLLVMGAVLVTCSPPLELANFA